MKRIFEFGGDAFELAGDAALYWPRHDALLVSDLHLEKASAYAAGGQMLPPYDSLATIQALASLSQIFRPARIICLGDNFHDIGGEKRLGSDAADILSDLIGSTKWVWITGNHDPVVEGRWGGVSVAEMKLGDILLRHEATAGEALPEISGHFHPKFRQVLRGRMISRRCFVKSSRKLIMPAFGTLTGGMDVHEAAILKACDLADGENADAMIPVHNGFTRFVLKPDPNLSMVRR
ncbi:ligase-associated DNA damage response endonuclease PdeM [Sphingorhabdus sp. IMCC26285]|uniref:Ligase-associated DNA damage response endonuclease PdeM n=1 Tax=Sphingorhabdus profundilacus TaxID=2509718 RepID=A0A6I4M262_9SPHN|nr:ligase-associated DNA damage response endonuclease PdeM [Sphingorhabdus profundilacus]MVZ98433.1 ligase-associated DNA damage response endonuclease PdeM [Sphingorhabdus profundilacus]